MVGRKATARGGVSGPVVDLAVVREFGETAARIREVCNREYTPENAWRQPIDLGETIKGLTLTGLPPRIYKGIERELLPLNAILKKYGIDTFEDYRRITPADRKRIRQGFLKVCELVPAQYRKG